MSTPPPNVHVRAPMGRCHGRGTPAHHVAACPRGLPVRNCLSVRGCGRGDAAGFRRGRLLCQRQPDAQPGQRRTGARRGAVPDQSGTRTSWRGRTGTQRKAHACRAGAQPRHGQRGLLLTHRAQWRNAAPADASERLHPQRAGRVHGRREHRVGHDVAGHAAVDRERLDGLPRTPRQHPRRRLPRNGGRGRAAAPRRARRRAARGAVHPGLRHDRPRRALLAPLLDRCSPLGRRVLDPPLGRRARPPLPRPLGTDNLRRP